jgi:hypothetical protein
MKAEVREVMRVLGMRDSNVKVGSPMALGSERAPAVRPSGDAQRSAGAVGRLARASGTLGKNRAKHKSHSMRALLTLFLLPAALSASAAPPVYRCETAGKVSYSDSPCVGAKVIDATPNQGVDQMSGKSRKGRDVQRTELNHAFDNALRPLTGKSRDQMDVMRQRIKLPARDQGECRQLDIRLPELEAATLRDTGASKAKADVDLYQTRKRYFDLKC